ncbi:HMCN [Lepeophtheirus salmonis]|uniref:HMCN n=1 Tax=Lepeophtheirus salmonis TaxID=72036 RepID=A0A7R8D4S2_LEPSM|nr:HMCN [Lepeophtheirus salmonis]CAF3027866.1 HMCN [Lepeophtheirus salmonis]
MNKLSTSCLAAPIKKCVLQNTPSVKWIQNGEALSVSSEFILQNVSEDTDLICIADNELGQDERKIHLIDESKDLTCKAEIDERLISSSLLHYKWYLNGSLLENDGKDHFRIDSASDGDISGNYTCVIETPVEDVKVEYNVLVVSAPVIDSQFSKTLKVLKKSPYPSVQCSAHGDPEPRVSWIWSVDDKEVIVNESTLLSLNTSLAIDSTIFTCQAESVHGLTQRNFTLRAFEPTFVLQNDTTISVNASGKVILKCESAVDPRLESSSSITWLKDNKPLQHFITKDDEVLIPYLHLDHGGMYSCLTRTPLEINVKRVTEGSDVSITCNASGVPHPSIHWKKDADNIKVSDGENLIIRHIGVEDTGHYSCLAVNEYGSKQESLSIEVYNKTTVAVDKETLISETSDLVVLECPVRLDKRLNIVSITWYKDGLNESISNETKLVIRNATKEDQGTYICRGPSFLSTEEDIRTLEGTNVTVNCQANGLPIPKISWTNNGVQILKGDDRRTVSPLGDLTIHYVSLNDQGNYTCTATNIYGSISTQSTIEVILRSKMATDFKKVKNVIKNVRENVVLDCDVVYDSRLDREIELLWKKDNLPIRINRSKYIAADNSLKVYNLDISDQGTYECQVNTPFESISSKTALIVSGEPPKIVSEFKKVMLDEGEDLRLECLVRGVPRPTLVWYFQDAPLTNAYVHEIATASKVFRESRVIVKNVTKANDGVYQCRADNDYGTGVAKFSRVNVLRRTRATISESGEISIHAGTNLKIPCNIEKDQMNQITNIQWVKPFKVGAKDRIDFGVDGSLTNSFCDCFCERECSFHYIFYGNGIPKPIISWNFNKTDTKIDNNAEFKILNAIASDSGSYECVAKNQYGETRKIIFVRVIQVPPVDEEVAVDDGEPADLYCIKPNNYVHIQWRDPKEQNISDYDSETGVLHFKSVNQENIGEYSCIISLNNGRSRAIKRHLRIKPEIIMKCNVLPGIGAKRLWKHNENIIIPGGNREVSNRGGLLTIEDIRQDEDSGKYVCIAIADFGKDTIEYTVHVDPIPVSKKEVSCTESHSNPIFLFDVIRTGNESVLIRWEFPDLFNTSCYEALFLTWWTDEKDSPFSEEDFQLIQSPARGIDDFMQNLAPQWPEPEPPAKLGGDEDDESAAFIKIQQPSQNNMQQSNNSQAHHHHHHNRHPSQNNSISSSWSSLFNMPIDPATVRMNANNKSRFSGFVT